MKGESKTYDIRAEGDELVLWLYDEIGDRGLFSESESVRDLNERIATYDGSQITVRINSPGGSVWDGMAIHSALTQSKANVTAYVDGIAASIASLIAMAADRIVMAPGAMLMIHDPWAAVAGSAEELRSVAGVLDKVRDSMVGIYAGRTGQSEETVRAWMAAETWFGADEALAAGLADEVGSQLHLAACAWDLTAFGYQRVPDVLADWELVGHEVRHRVRDPQLFEGGSFRTGDLKLSEEPGVTSLMAKSVYAVFGQLAQDDGSHKAGSMAIQSVRFRAEVQRGEEWVPTGWTQQTAREWWDRHGSGFEDEATLEPLAAGRVLSQANYDRIRQAHDLLNEVLAAADGAQPDAGSAEGSAGAGSASDAQADAATSTVKGRLHILPLTGAVYFEREVKK